MPMSDYVRNLRDKIGHDVLMTVGATGVVINEQGEILLHRRSDTGRWGTPGGAIDPGEEPAEAAVREVWEETGVEVVPERISAIYTTPLVHYPNGDAICVTSIVFVCRPVGGEPRINDSESLEVRYFPVEALPDMEPRIRLRIDDALRAEPRTLFRVTTQQEKTDL